MAWVKLNNLVKFSDTLSIFKKRIKSITSELVSEL